MKTEKDLLKRSHDGVLFVLIICLILVFSIGLQVVGEYFSLYMGQWPVLMPALNLGL